MDEKKKYPTRVKPKNIIHLIWLEKADDDITKHEYYSYASALFDDHSEDELGFHRTSLNNAFSVAEKAGQPAVYVPRSGKVKVIRGILKDKKKVSSNDRQ